MINNLDYNKISNNLLFACFSPPTGAIGLFEGNPNVLTRL
jgi:hypothetical protein